MNITEAFAKVAEARMENADKSMRKLAKDSGVGLSSLSDLFNGRCQRISLEQALKIANGLDASLMQLIKESKIKMNKANEHR